MENMNKPNGDSATNRKRKRRRRQKHSAKRNRSRSQNGSLTDYSNSEISLEASLDLSSTNIFTSLTPSKSEFRKEISVTDFSFEEHPSIVSEQENISCILDEQSFEDSNEESFSYHNISEEFGCKKVSKRNTQIVSADLNLEDASMPVKISQKKIRKGYKKKETDESPITDDEVHSKNYSLKRFFEQEVNYCYSKDDIIVCLEENATIYCHGLCLLSVLHGEVEIFGHTLSEKSPEIKLYSLRGASLLYIKNLTKSNTSPKFIPKDLKITQNCALVRCKKLNDPNLLFVEKHISQQILPKEDNFPRLFFKLKEDSWNLIKIDPSWDIIIEGIGNKTKLIICGGKGVGKTTFLRYAINKLLINFKEVRIIDLDPGQSEFTMPGCISIVKVSEPVFGINFTHLKNSEKSILSNINIAYEPETYIESVKDLLNSNVDEIPTLVNYMGYNHGIGLNILSAIITIIQPTDVLQINSHDVKKNYKYSLTPEIVTKNAKLFIPAYSSLEYMLHQTRSMCDENENWIAEPRQLREMSILSYLSRMVQSDSIFTSKAPLYKINLNDVIVSNLQGENVHLAAINACLVALCSLKNAEKIRFQCLGWGIVRGIDLSLNELVLLTSEPVEVLDKVSHLISSGISLPPSVYMTPDEVTGAMPYVVEGNLLSFGQFTKRSKISTKSAN